jgi:hypothetical protein
MALHLTQSLIHVCLVVLQNSLRRIEKSGPSDLATRESAIVFGMDEIIEQTTILFTSEMVKCQDTESW